jgi:hypothetical protein
MLLPAGGLVSLASLCGRALSLPPENAHGSAKPDRQLMGDWSCSSASSELSCKMRGPRPNSKVTQRPEAIASKHPRTQTRQQSSTISTLEPLCRSERHHISVCLPANQPCSELLIQSYESSLARTISHNAPSKDGQNRHLIHLQRVSVAPWRSGEAALGIPNIEEET